MKYYIYFWLDDIGLPFYVGEGFARRAYSLHRNVETPRPGRSHIHIVEKNLSKFEAQLKEWQWIRFFGRKIDGGLLDNKAQASFGIPNTTGVIRTEESRKKQSETSRGHIKSAESRSNISDGMSKYTLVIQEPDGTIVTTNNMMKYCKDRGLRYDGLVKVRKGICNHYKGYKILFKNGEPIKYSTTFSRIGGPYEITFPDGTQEVIDNLETFCSQYSLCRSTMVRVANGERNQHWGYRIKRIT